VIALNFDQFFSKQGKNTVKYLFIYLFIIYLFIFYSVRNI